MPEKPFRIGLWNTAFLGDAVLTLPLAQTLRRAYPTAILDFYVRGGLEPLFASHPLFTNVYGVHKKNKSLCSILTMGKAIQKREYSLWVAAHSSLRTGMISALSRAPSRIGYSETLLHRLWFTKTTSRRFTELDEIERLLELARAAEGTELEFAPHFVVSDEANKEADAFFAKVALQAPAVIGLHPGSVWETKRWPAESFAEVGRLALEAGAAVIVFAGPGEEGLAQATLQRLQDGQPSAVLPRIIDLSGALTLPQLGAYIARLSCYVSNDSGPMHVSWVQGVPTVALFGPTVKSLGFFPRGEKTHVVEIPLACRPCGLHGHKQCPLKHHDCMRMITPAMVWEFVHPYICG